jgi:hypothetical protein
MVLLRFIIAIIVCHYGSCTIIVCHYGSGYCIVCHYGSCTIMSLPLRFGIYYYSLPLVRYYYSLPLRFGLIIVAITVVYHYGSGTIWLPLRFIVLL